MLYMSHLPGQAMTKHVADALTARRRDRDLGALAVLSMAVGAWTGLVVAGFRLALDAAGWLRNALLAGSHRWPVGGFALVVCAGAGVATGAAWLARRFSPYAEGSGIPEVEVALRRKLPARPLLRLLMVKFVGGLLAIGGGLALGPEGPSVQMGAVGARLIGARFRRRWPDLHALVAAGTGAGLAVAFNAPIAGAVFVLEELLRRFETRVAIAALGASSTAILVARLFLGDAPLFDVRIPAAPPAAAAVHLYGAGVAWLGYLVVGAVAGLGGTVYNRALTGALDVAERLDRWSYWKQAVAVGALVGVVGWYAPWLIGGGERLTEATLAGTLALSTLPLIFAFRYCFSAVCYGVRAPGGLFAPLLLLGAQLGWFCGGLGHAAFPAFGIDPRAFAVVGMAAFFTGVVRAPVTGIVLVIEMTGAVATLLPMLVACFVAMAVADLVGIPPIYDALRERLLQRMEGSSEGARASQNPVGVT